MREWRGVAILTRTAHVLSTAADGALPARGTIARVREQVSTFPRRD